MIFSVENGSFSYSKGGRQILKNVNFSVTDGDLLAILGPNGAGKTTLLRCMMGFLKWDSGKSAIDSRNIAEMTQREIFSRIAYVPQARSAAVSSTVRDMVLLGRGSRYGIFGKPTKEDRQIAEETIESIGLKHLAGRLCSELSGGELQMALIARAIASEPELIILDEPESNLDFKNQLVVLKALHELSDRGITCIFNTHYPVHALRHASKALLLDKSGNVLFGDTLNVITENNMKAAFGVETVIGQIETPHSIYTDVLAVNTLSEETRKESVMTEAASNENTRLAILGIIVENRDSAERINELLHDYGKYIVGRMGMPYEKKELSIISVIMDAPEAVISTLSGKLGMLNGVSVKATYSKK